jgi:hypothetical protein
VQLVVGDVLVVVGEDEQGAEQGAEGTAQANPEGWVGSRVGQQAGAVVGSAGELVEPVAEEGGFGRAEREGGLVRGGEGSGGEAGVRGRGELVVREPMGASRILAQISGSRSSAGAPINDRVTLVSYTDVAVVRACAGPGSIAS